MSARPGFTEEEARRIGRQIEIDWESAPFDVEQFRMGRDVELEHGLRDSAANVSNHDPVTTGKIALAHLNEFPDYYNRLERMAGRAGRRPRCSCFYEVLGAVGEEVCESCREASGS